MKLDSTISLALLVTVCSIIAPVLTSLISNHYMLKNKEIDYEREVLNEQLLHKRQLFESFLKCIGNAHRYNGSKEELLGAYYALLPYIPHAERHFFKDITFSTISNKTVPTLSEMEHMLSVISKELTYKP